MNQTPTKAGEVGAILRAGGALTLAQLAECGICPQDVDEKWMDEMVKRLFHEIRKQLSQLETAKAASDDAGQAGRRSANARTLAALERTLERLETLQQRRVLDRERKVVKADEYARAALERRLDQLLEAARAQVPADKPEQ